MSLDAIKTAVANLDSIPAETITESVLKEKGLKNIQLHGYQLTGVSWLLHCTKNGHGGILADEMGLGKTCQTIATLTALSKDQKKHRALILCPLSVIRNWETELTSFSDLKFLTYVGPREVREELQSDFKSNHELQILLTTYDLCMNDEEFILSQKWSTVAVDEAHRLKNMNSMLHGLVDRVKCPQVLLLTGTPVQNNLKELYALLNIVASRIFRKRYEEDFVEHFSHISSPDCAEAKELRQILSHFLLRRTKNEVHLDLPHKTEVILYHEITDLQKKYYKAFLLKDLDVFNGGSKTKLLNILMQLRKCINHPYLFDGVEPEPFEMGEHLVEASGKMLLIDHLLRFLKPLGHKVLLFSQMTRMLDIIQDYLTYRGYSYERLDGSVRGEERYLAVKNFNDQRNTFVFLLSTKAGGVGLNLVAADTVIFVDSDFNPQNDIQAAARAHRIGQSRPVRILRLVGKNTVDEIILHRAEAKLALTQHILEGGQYSDVAAENKLAAIAKSSEELRDILKFGLHELMDSSSAHNTVKNIDLEAILGATNEKGEWQPLKVEDVEAEGGEVAASLLHEDNDKEMKDEEEVGISQKVNHMYIFEGRDYSKAVSRKDEEVFSSLVKKKQEDLSKGDNGTEDISRRRQKAAEAGVGHVALPMTSKPRRVLTDEEKAEARRKREEKELQRAQEAKHRQQEKWKKRGYVSMAVGMDEEEEEEEVHSPVSSVSDVEDAVAGESEGRVKSRQIRYVKGDVSRPRVRDGDAIICHALDDSGAWGSGGVFSALLTRSPKPKEQYELAGEVGDLALGDVHLVPCDDITSRSDGHDFVALLVCQHRDRRNNLSGLKLHVLEECLNKVRHVAAKLKASVHLPRMGHNTPNFNWYGVEKLIRKCLVLHGVPATVYYFQRGQKHRADHNTPSTSAVKMRVDDEDKGDKATETIAKKPRMSHKVSDSGESDEDGGNRTRAPEVRRVAAPHRQTNYEMSDSEPEDNEHRNSSPTANVKTKDVKRTNTKLHDISDSGSDDGHIAVSKCRPDEEDSS